MVRLSGTVTYKDGTTERYEAGGAILVEWEDYATRNGYPLTPRPDTLQTFPVKKWQMYLAFAALERPEGFDAWRKTVDDVESDDQPEPVPPTQAAATAAP